MPYLRPIQLVHSALAHSDAGMRDADNAELHGVAVKTIRRWRRLYQREGMTRQPYDVGCPRCDGHPLDAGAYAELLGWYLGDGYVAVSARGQVVLHVINDAQYTGDIERISSLMAAVKPGAGPFRRQLPGAVSVSLGWKHWVCLFPQHGAGRKHERPIVLAGWQQQIADAHPKPLLRGLFHSDGCRVMNWTVRPLAAGPKRYEYPRYLFSNESPDIIGICAKALDTLGLHWTLSRPNLLSVARKADVAALDTFVGAKH